MRPLPPHLESTYRPMHPRSCFIRELRSQIYFFFFSSRRRHTRLQGDWSSDVCSSDLVGATVGREAERGGADALAEADRRDRDDLGVVGADLERDRARAAQQVDPVELEDRKSVV